MVSNNLIKGIAIGGLIGAGVGILIAPKSGKDTREQIRNTAQDVLEKAKAQYEEAARKLETLTDAQQRTTCRQERPAQESIRCRR